MSQPLQYDLLDREYLLYELHIRGVSNISSKVKNDTLSKNLSYLLACEQAGVEYDPAIDLDAVREIQTCVTIFNQLESFTYGILYEELIFKLDVTFWHVRNRLGRIVTENDDQVQQVTNLLDRLDVLETIYTKKRKFLLELSPKGKVKETDNSDDLNKSGPSTSPSNVTEGTRLPPIIFNDPDYVPVAKWGFYFEGKYKDSLDVLEFIRKVNQMCKIHSVPEHKLLTSINCLFKGRADVWYRSVQPNVVSWGDLCDKLKKEFLPRNFEKVIKRRIKERYQKKNETIGTFIAHLDDLSSYLPTPLSDSKRLDIIKQNMLPEYQEKLALIEVNSEKQLIELIDKIDECKVSLDRVRDVSTKRSEGHVRFLNSIDYKNLSEDENNEVFSEYSKSKSHSSRSRCRRNSSENNSRNSSFNRNRSSSGNRSPSNNRPSSSKSSVQQSSNESNKNSNVKTVNSLRCYKCDSDQHLVRNCSSKLVKCFKCGNLGYTALTCPKCLSLRTNSQGNGHRT